MTNSDPATEVSETDANCKASGVAAPSGVITERSEILFIYQVRDCNPNGDPLEENQPRVDPETGVATVSDVRIKRTIRDYWRDVKNLEIWIRNGVTDDGLPETAEQRREAFENGAKDPAKTAALRDLVLAGCIDARVFGCILAVAKSKGKKRGKSKSEAPESGPDQEDRLVSITGPVQFSGFNRSLNRVAVQLVQGTAAFSSREGAGQKSFRTDYLLPYAVIGVYGVINEKSATGTLMSPADRELVLEGLWKGTEHLHSRSKMGHHPLALLELRSPGGFRIGDLPSRLKLVKSEDVEETALRSLDQFQVDASALVDAIRTAVDRKRIGSVRLRIDPRLQIRAGDESLTKAVEMLKRDGLSVDTAAFDSW